MAGDLPPDLGEGSTVRPPTGQWTPAYPAQPGATLTHVAIYCPGRDRNCRGSRCADRGPHKLHARGPSTYDHAADLYRCRDRRGATATVRHVQTGGAARRRSNRRH